MPGWESGRKRGSQCPTLGQGRAGCGESTSSQGHHLVREPTRPTGDPMSPPFMSVETLSPPNIVQWG